MQAKSEIRSKVSKAGLIVSAVLLCVSAKAQQAPSLNIAVEPNVVTRHIIVSIPDRKLALVENGEVKKIFPVAVGKEHTPSPTGSFHVISRVANPTYYHEGKIVPPGPANPVGTRWMGLSERGYGIHGTNAPGSIGKAASHGCIRMARADLEQLFALVQVGDAVEIRAERDEEIAAIFGSAEQVAVLKAAQPITVADNTVLADAAAGLTTAAQ